MYLQASFKIEPKSQTDGLFSGNPPFFMNRVFSAPFAKLFQFQLPFNFLFVFRSVISTPFADGAFERY